MISKFKEIEESVRKGSLYRSKKIDVFDRKALLSEKVAYVSQGFGPYGAEFQLKKFAGIDTDLLLNNCTIEHGAGIRRAVCQIEVMHPVSYILTFSPYREEVIEELTDIVPVALGPYIAYAEEYRPKQYISEMRAKYGRTLLVMPTHSIQGIEANYNIQQLIKQIEEIRKQFDTVMVCLYYEDLKKQQWRIYGEKGYHIVSAGNTQSPFFLSRLKYIFRICDAVVVNDITTGVAHAMYMGLPVRLIRQKIDYDVSIRNNAYELGFGNQYERFCDLFTNCEFMTSKEQIEYGNYVFGLRKVKTKEELYKILISSSRLS